MPKAYWIAHVDVHDPEAYKDYVSTAAPAFVEHGARFLARGGATEGLEGEPRARNVVIEFDSMEAARLCYESESYQRAKAIRQRCASGEILLVEGVPAAGGGAS